ncbi:MAG: response regulator [Anaerolineales bacterium]|nr:response regulator [Anaerolineales bacterium]
MSDHIYTILVIDDELITRTTLAALLDKPIYHVEMAEDGIQGIEMAKQLNPDVILLDVMMPRMNGYDVCKRIRSDPQIAEVPIILITALDDRDAKLNGLVVGADDFLAKPFDTLELEIRLHTLRHVDRYRHLVQEREKLQETLAELSTKNRQLQILSQQMLVAQENERRRVAVELHDEIGQLITGLKLILERKQDDMSTLLAEARAVANELMQRVREMSLDLRPAALDDLGLPAALSDLFKRFTSQTKITIHHNINPLDERRFDKAIEIAAFRVVQETLTNVARHAEVNEAAVTLTITPDHMQISIADDGKGFDINSKDITASTGLSGMAERVNMAGGHFSLESTPGKGTLVLAVFDLKQAE